MFKATAASLIQPQQHKYTFFVSLQELHHFICFILAVFFEIVPLVSLFTLTHPCVSLLWLFSSSYSLHQLWTVQISPWWPCPLLTSTVCMCVCVREGVCGSLLAQMSEGCVQCVNLGLVGLLRHDPDYVGPCLLSGFSSVTLHSYGQPTSQTRI